MKRRVQTICRYCGCTAARACQTDDGPCRWIIRPTKLHPGVCSSSNCLLAFDRDRQIERIAGAKLGGLFDAAQLKPHRAYRRRRTE